MNTQLDLIVSDESKTVNTTEAKKTTVKKTVKATTAKKSVKTTNNVVTANNNKTKQVSKKTVTKLHTELLAVLTQRLESVEKESGKLCTSLRNDIKAFSNFALIEQCLEIELDVKELINKLKITDKSDANFIALKVITKYRQAVQAIAQKNFNLFDGYTQAVLHNLVKYNNLTIKECYACMSKNIAQPTPSKKIDRVKVTSLSTATTQACSTRMLLSHLNICNIDKNKSDDKMTFANNELVKVVKQIVKKGDFMKKQN